MQSYLNTGEKINCCGCGACVSVCPKGCIELKEDERGFFYPVIDREKCIGCGACERVCLYNGNGARPARTVSFYAGHSRNTEQMKASSSGGIFPLVATDFLSRGGVVYGVTLDEKQTVRFRRVDAISDLPALQGSKYVQASPDGVYGHVKDDLSAGRHVLFSGTPCQIAALSRFVGESDLLYTVSVICHGVPSQRMFTDYIRYLEAKHRGKLTAINFRDKEKYGWSITLSYVIETKGKSKKYSESSKLSPYFTGFLRGLILRESCHACRFAGVDHGSDLMLGDFWGYQTQYEGLKSKDGFSLLSVNSEKGRELLDAVRDKMTLGEVALSDALASGNGNLGKPTAVPPQTDALFRDYEAYGFDYIAKKYLAPAHPVKERIKALIPPSLLAWKRKRAGKR